MMNTSDVVFVGLTIFVKVFLTYQHSYKCVQYFQDIFFTFSKFMALFNYENQILRSHIVSGHFEKILDMNSFQNFRFIGFFPRFIWKKNFRNSTEKDGNFLYEKKTINKFCHFTRFLLNTI